MSKCRYNLSENCNNKDCLICVLDKIRAEIIEACGYSKDYVGAFTYSIIELKTVLQIIDKYKAESEVSDGNSN